MVTATVFYQVANNPEKQRKLQEELDRVIPDPSQPITDKQLEEMKYCKKTRKFPLAEKENFILLFIRFVHHRYMKGCIKETMRVMPILIGTARNSPRDIVIHGYRMPKEVSTFSDLSQKCNSYTNFERALRRHLLNRFIDDTHFAECADTVPFMLKMSIIMPKRIIGPLRF